MQKEAAMPKDTIESPVSLEEYRHLSMEERRKIWIEISDITADDLQHHMDEQKARETSVPQPGDDAPDFTADVLDRDRQRTGAQITLSALRGKPVGIFLGSYT
jgi:hypothetical protein